MRWTISAQLIGLTTKSVAPDVVRLIDRERIVVTGHHYDRQVRAAGQLANRRAGLVAAAVRHLHVEQRDIRQARGARGHSGIAGAHDLDVKAGGIQCRRGDVTQERVVVGDQDSNSLLSPCSR